MAQSELQGQVALLEEETIQIQRECHSLQTEQAQAAESEDYERAEKLDTQLHQLQSRQAAKLAQVKKL